MPFITLRQEALQYDGTNGLEIASTWLSDATLVSDNGQILKLKIAGYPPITYEIPKDYYVIRYYGKTYYQAINPDEYAQNWIEIASA